jgi:NADH-quinone oxidoreductase subunit J
MLELILFDIFKFLALISAILVINSKNPVHAVLFLVLVFANCSSILLLLEADFLALVLLVVYIGAIAVLFLFVVMVLNIKILELTSSDLNYIPINTFVLSTLTIQISYLIYSTFHADYLFYDNLYISYIMFIDSFSNIMIIGFSLILFYFFPLFLVAIILLLGMVGSIVLTLSQRLPLRRQSVYLQNSKPILKALVPNI